MAGCAKTIQSNLGITEVVEPPASCAKIRSATKIRILFFYPSIARYSQAEENRPSEKFHSTLKFSEHEGAGRQTRGPDVGKRLGWSDPTRDLHCLLGNLE